MTRPDTNRSPLLSLFERCSRLPLGNRIFSRLFTHKVPYFASIRPTVTVLRPNYCEVHLPKRRRVSNHIGTVHVIAICNALEMAMGAMAEASIPKHLRWIPKGMSVDYPAKADSDIRATARVDPNAWQPGELSVAVHALREDGTVVVEGSIRLHVSERPTGS